MRLVGGGRRAARSLAAVAAAGMLAAVAGAAPEPTVPRPLGYVSDYTGRLRPETVAELDALVRELRETTGAEIAVVVVGTTRPLTAFDYAMKIAEAWKPGDRQKDNGVVFLVAVEDRELFILTGYGVEDVLPDGRVGEIRDRLVLPAFRAGDLDGGIRAATREMAALIAGAAGVELRGAGPPAAAPRARPESGLPAWAGFLLLLVVLYIVARNPALATALAGQHGRRRGIRWGGGFGGGFGGGGFGGGGGGFGGFGGGSFGGGGAGGRW